MPLGLENFQPETFEQANPVAAGYAATLGMNQTALQNASLAAQLPYVGQNASGIAAQNVAQGQIQGAQVPYAGQNAQSASQVSQAQARQAQYNTQASQLPLSQPGITGTLAQIAAAQKQNPQFFGGQSAPQGVAPPTISPGGNTNYTNPSTLQTIPGALTAPSAGAPTSQLTIPTPGSPSGGIGSQLASAAIYGPTAEIAKNQALAANAQARTASLAWQQLPKDQQDQYLAQLGGLGVSPNKAIPYYNAGYSVGDVAKAEGFDPNNLPAPAYPLSAAGVTQMQRRQVADGEMGSLQTFAGKALAPYATTVDGWSPSLIHDMATGQNTNQVTDALAAKGLVPELSAMRLRIMNGQVGIGAIQEVTNAAMDNVSNLKVPGVVMTPQLFQQTQQKIQDQINQAFNAGNQQVLSNPTNTAQAKARQTQGQQQGQSSQQYSDADLQFTAQKHGMTIAQVKQKLGVQ